MQFLKVFGSISVFIILLVLGWNNLFISEKEIPVPSFTAIYCQAPANVFLQKAEKASVTLRADDGIHEKMLIEVVNNELRITNLEVIRQERVLDVYVNYTDLAQVHASGASEFRGRGILRNKSLNLTASEVSEILMQVEADSLNLEMTGSANVQLAGKVNYFEFLLTHLGDLMAYNLASQHCKAVIRTGDQSPGYARIHVEQSLDAEIKGPRHLRYKGKPKIQRQEIEGKGKLISE